jgi:hypothetical protein
MEHTFAFVRGARGRLVIVVSGLLACIPLASMALQPRSSVVGESFISSEPLIPVCFDGETIEVTEEWLQQALSNGGDLGSCTVSQAEQAAVSVQGFSDDESDSDDEDEKSSSSISSIPETPSWALPQFMRSLGSSVSSISSEVLSSFSSIHSSSSSSSETAAQVLGTQDMEDRTNGEDGGIHIESHMNVNIRTSNDGQTVETRHVWENGELKVSESNISGGVSSMYYDDELNEEGEDYDDDMPEWMEDMFDD